MNNKRKKLSKKAKKILVFVSLILFAAVGTYILKYGFAASPTATASCGARVSNYTYQVPFGNAVWNQPVCGLARYSKSADYVNRFYKWANMNDGSAAGQASNGDLSVKVAFPKPTLLDPEGLNGLFGRTIYSSSDATTEKLVFSSVYLSNLDGVKSQYSTDSDRLNFLPVTKIPWNPAWRVGTGGDNEMLILDESDGRIISISGYKKDLAAVTQCGPLYLDRICSYNTSVARDLNGNIADYRSYEGFVSDRGVGISNYAMVVTPQEVKAGEIRHALGVSIPNTATGPICTSAQLGTTAEGKTCGTAVAPASKFEWGGVDSMAERGNVAAEFNSLYTQDKLIPEGMRYALDINDAGIETWINSRADLVSNPRRAQTARIFARALRDFGLMIVDTNGAKASVQLETGINPDSATQWDEVGMGAEYNSGMLDGLITASNLYVVDPPTATCQNGVKSKYFCQWSAMSYGSVTNPTPDTTPPTLSITQPAPNAQLKGLVTVSGTATDNIAVAKVELVIDGTVRQTAVSQPYSFTLDTAQLTKGTHTIMLRAYDVATTPNKTEKSITVTVDNTTTPTPVVVGDFTADGKVGTPDLAVLLTNYNKNVAVGKLGDCSGDGKVSLIDLSILLSNYGK